MAAFATEQLLEYLALKLYTETPLVPHGKVLSIPYYTLLRPCQIFLTLSVQLQGLTLGGIIFTI